MLFFFVGENACALNVLVWKETSYLLEYAHSAGMAICLGFVAYALLEGLDRRVVGLSAPNQHCAAMNLCGKCIKHADVPCGLRRIFTMLILLCIVVACMLPTADWHDTAYNTTVFGQFYPYGHLRVFQMFENWACAAAAVLFLATALVLVQFPGIEALHRAQIMFAAGVGPLGFGSAACADGRCLQPRTGVVRLLGRNDGAAIAGGNLFHTVDISRTFVANVASVQFASSGT